MDSPEGGGGSSFDYPKDTPEQVANDVRDLKSVNAGLDNELKAKENAIGNNSPTDEQKEYRTFNNSFRGAGERPISSSAPTESANEKRGFLGRLFHRGERNSASQESSGKVALGLQKENDLTDKQTIEVSDALSEGQPTEDVALAAELWGARNRVLDKKAKQQKLEQEMIAMRERAQRGDNFVDRRATAAPDANQQKEVRPFVEDNEMASTAQLNSAEKVPAFIPGTFDATAADEPLSFVEKNAEPAPLPKAGKAPETDLGDPLYIQMMKEQEEANRVIDNISEKRGEETFKFQKEENNVDPISIGREGINTIFRYPDRYTGQRTDEDSVIWNITIGFADKARREDKEGVRITNRNNQRMDTRVERTVMLQKEDESGLRYIQTEEGEWFRAKVYPSEPGSQSRYLFLGEYVSASVEEVTGLAELIEPVKPDNQTGSQLDLTPGLDMEEVRKKWEKKFPQQTATRSDGAAA